MASIGISEFTFGFAFLYEQTQASWKGLRAAPVLPSLQDEGGKGWDAKLPVRGTDFYYQFKLSELLSRSNASYIADGTYVGPYHRLALHPKHGNRQHRLMRELAQANRHTYYVAPEFTGAEEFNAAFLDGKVKDGSRLIPVRDCEDVHDGQQHFITFQRGSAGWIFHSEPVQHERSVFGRDLEDLYRRTQDEWRPFDKSFAQRLLQRTTSVVERALDGDSYRSDPYLPPYDLDTAVAGTPLEEPARATLSFLDFDDSQADRSEVLMRVSQVLSMVMGVRLVLVGSSQ